MSENIDLFSLDKGLLVKMMHKIMLELGNLKAEKDRAEEKVNKLTMITTTFLKIDKCRYCETRVYYKDNRSDAIDENGEIWGHGWCCKCDFWLCDKHYTTDEYRYYTPSNEPDRCLCKYCENY